MNTLKGFEVRVEIPESEALAYGFTLAELAKIATSHIQAQVPTAKLYTTAMVNAPKVMPNIRWDKTKKALYLNTREVALTRTEEIIFARLAETPDIFVSYAEIVALIESNVKPITSPTHLRVTMHRLRAKLGLARTLIRTDRENGYTLRTSGVDFATV